MDNIVIDNFDAVKKQLNFDTLGEFYFIQIVRRSKDNPDMSKYMKVVRSFYIFTEEDYEHYRPIIKKLCIENNARAYLIFNKLNVNEIKDKAREILDKYCSYGYQLNNKKWFMKLQYCFDDASAIVSTSNKDNEYFIVDIDEHNQLEKIREYVKKEGIYIFDVPTVAGNHIVIKHWDNQRPFFDTFKDVDVSIMPYCEVFLYANIKR